MAEDEKNAGWRDKEHDELDRELDAALAKYAAVEPRAGLEERVLANLRAAPAQASGRRWWRWSVLVAVAAVVVVAVALAWRSQGPSPPVVANQPSTTTQGPQELGTQVAPSGQENGIHRHAPHPWEKANHRSHQPVVAASAPKLDQFPSPQPLSEQEKILASYVAEYPEHAVLVAQARAEALLRDQEEEEREAGHERDSQPRNK